MDDSNAKQGYAINMIFTQALLWLPILAWNGLINELLGKLFPRRTEHVWVMLAYAVIITAVAIALYVASPLRMPPVVELRAPRTPL
jgi:uncharacterized membrane protein YidH (DUF202 family)